MPFLHSFLVRFFPPVCVGCEREGFYFCDKCQNEIDFLFYTLKLPLLEGFVKNVGILGFFAPPLSTAIKALKYHSLWPLGSILGDLLYKHVMLPSDIDFVAAVPLHPKRWRERGYNQAELAARQLAKRLNKPYAPLLLRQHYSQNLASTTSDEERFALIRNAFAINPSWKEKIQGKNILLVDDVVTTGSTLAACAQALNSAEVTTISAAVVAHES